MAAEGWRVGASWPSITPGSLGAPSSPQLCHKHLWPRGCSCAGSFLLSLAQCAPPREVASSLFLAGVLSPAAASSPCVPSNVPVPKLTVSPRQEFSFFPREPSSAPRLPAVLRDRHRFPISRTSLDSWRRLCFLVPVGTAAPIPGLARSDKSQSQMLSMQSGFH